MMAIYCIDGNVGRAAGRAGEAGERAIMRGEFANELARLMRISRTLLLVRPPTLL